MGNSNSTDVERLKQLYSMNNLQLEALRNDLNQQRQINAQQEEYYKGIINNLLQKQDNIKNRIPENHYNKVNDFLNGVNRDIQSKKTGVTNWKPGQSSNISNTNNISNNSNLSNYNNQDNSNSQNNQQRNRAPYGQERNYEDIKKSQNEIDPYKLYELEKGKPFSLDELKEKYRRYALKTHPDVEGGNERNFSIVNNAYKFLIEEHKKMELDKQFNQLKNDSLVYLETQEKGGLMNREFSGQNFNVNRFNQVFQDNRLEDPSSEGYDSWIKDNQYSTEDIRRDTSVTTGNFNSQFDSRVKVCRELQVYQIPQVLNSSTSRNVQELGVERVDNYSGESGGGSGKILYTDLKEAHTTSRLVDPNTKYKTYKNINDLEGARANMGDMSQEEQNMLEEMEVNRNSEEARREENQRRMDRLFSDHHSRTHNIFLGSSSSTNNTQNSFNRF